MIRPAMEQDVGAIVRMSAAFYATTTYSAVTGMDADTVEVLTRGLISTGVMLVAELDGDVVGMIGLVIAPFLFDNSIKTAHEVVWYVSPQVRGGRIGVELMRAAEDACREKGAKAVQMVMLANSPPVAARIYESMGYARSEACFTKRLA